MRFILLNQPNRAGRNNVARLPGGKITTPLKPFLIAPIGDSEEETGGDAGQQNLTVRRLLPLQVNRSFMWHKTGRLFAGGLARPKIRSAQDAGEILRRTAADYVLDGQSVQQRLLNIVMLFVVLVPAAWLLIRFRDAMTVLNAMIEHVIRR